VSSLRRFILSWLHADRDALDHARALATQLSKYDRVHRFALEQSRRLAARDWFAGAAPGA
jgi:hypothetical protein